MFFFDCNASFGRELKSGKFGIETAEELTAQMKAAGVDAAVVYKKEQINSLSPKDGNIDLSKSITEYPNLFGLWMVVPKYTNEIPQPEIIADQMKADRIIGFKYAPGANRFVPRAFAIKDYIDVMIECSIPMFVNSKDGTSLSDMADILEKYPELMMVIAYADVWPNDRFLRPFIGEYKNVYLDLTYCITAGGIESFTSEFGADRLLFGSGFPNSYLGANMLMIKHADISHEEKELIAGSSLKRIIGGIRL